MDILTGDAIWHVMMPNRPLVEGVLWEGDVLMLLGSEKAGKSILGLQLAFSLSSGTPFLGKYLVCQPTPVMYVQTEGKESEMVDRMQRMRQEVPVDQTRFSRIFQHFLPIDDPKTNKDFIAKVKELEAIPKVIILDSLYTAMSGDLNENQPVRRFIVLASEIIKQLDTTLIIIHHETKELWEAGRMVDKGDRSSYGSVFFRAWVSHILYLRKHRDKSRTLTCDTQRSGHVLEKEELTLIEPTPLFFQLKSKQVHAPATAKVLHFLGKAGEAGLTREALVEKTELALPTIEEAIHKLAEDGLISRSQGRPVVYKKCDT